MNAKKLLAGLLTTTMVLGMGTIAHAENEGTHIYVLTASEDHGWTGSVATFAKEKAEEVNEEGTYSAEVITAASASDQITSSVYRMINTLASYQTFYNFGNGKIVTVPIVGLVLILVVVIFTYLTTSTKFGKKVYAIGSNEKGAAMNGINVNLMKTIVFVITGALVGVGAFLWIAMNASSDPATTGKSNEMYAIASAVLGGISMSGGRGKCLGILFGAMSYTVIDKIIVALKMDSLINDAIKGIILLVVILIQLAGPKLKEKLGH